jgi:hypothetical protein
MSVCVCVCVNERERERVRVRVRLNRMVYKNCVMLGVFMLHQLYCVIEECLIYI